MDIHILRLRTYSAGYYAIGHAASEGGYGNYLESVGAWAANLRDQGYARIISVLIAFEWSDPTAGAPWDRVDESQPPKREAGTEVEAVFSLERITRRNRIVEADGRRVSRAGPIALTESRVLSSQQIPASARATLLGQAFTVEHPLDSVERDILQSLDKPVAISDLLAVGDKVGIDRKAVLAALDSLQRRGLVDLT
jgi:hypothetical protein